jgi:FixJ family two-component response regulator
VPAPIVYLTGHGDIPTSVRAIKAGAEDFLTKPISQETLLSAVRRALERREVELHRLDRLSAWQASLARLTPRERQVFELVVRGKINKQIGHELGTTERTIKAHRHRIMEKLGARSLVDLVAMAERLGILSALGASDSRVDT